MVRSPAEMGTESPRIRSVAIIGAGASGAAAAAALAAEDYYERIRVFERRETPGGTWIYDPDPNPLIVPLPGKIPPEIDPPLNIPANLPQTTPPSTQKRYDKTPIYAELTTNVPSIAMSFSDSPFAYGPFAPHSVPKQYIENYFATHGSDELLVLGTTVEDVSNLPGQRWNLTLRKHDPVLNVDRWWQEEFDALVLANGHYSVPYVPHVDGLESYIKTFPHRILHSKSYRSAIPFRDKRVLVIGNSASGHDITTALTSTARLPVYQSRRTPSRWDGPKPPPGIAWKPVIKTFLPDGTIVFADGSTLDNIDFVIYCTGYKISFPFWKPEAHSGRALWDYKLDRLPGNYLHVFVRGLPTLGIVGLPRTLTFRSFEYQAVALARIWAGRNAKPLPGAKAQEEWERQWAAAAKRDRRKFHDVPWDDGQTMGYLRELYEIAGLPRIEGQGRCPPVLNHETRWAIEHIRKYPEPGKGDEVADEWVELTPGVWRDSLHFI